jgi:aromatic ring-opening dioxygenase catalytic subunit (LigB family)
MPIVFASAGSHAPGITAWTDVAPKAQADTFLEGYHTVRRELESANPETILLLTSEHWANFFLNHIGAFCIGRGSSFQGPIEPWLKVPKSEIEGQPELAAAILEHAYLNGFELNYSDELLLDHGSMVPLSLILPRGDRKVVPLVFNTLSSPRPSARRCAELGRILRVVLDARPERIAVVATGGLSHDPGEVNHGFIDKEFDKKFLDQLTACDLEALGSYSDKELLSAGSGTLEVLAWICLAGIMGERRPHVVAYEAIVPWATGVGVVSYGCVA